MSSILAWSAIISAGLMEAVVAFSLHKSDGFTKPHWLLLAMIIVPMNLALFSFAIKEIPISTCYVIWCGIGVISVTFMGFILGDVITIPKVVFLILIVIGIIGLRFQ